MGVLCIALAVIACGAPSSPASAPVEPAHLETRAERPRAETTHKGSTDGAGANPAPTAYDASASSTTSAPGSAPVALLGSDAPSCPKPDPDAGIGHVPIANMESVIRSQIFPAAKRCFQRGLHEQDQEGRIVLRITVDSDGTVGGVEVVSNTGLSERVAACDVQAALRARFGCSPGGVVQVPFNFVVNRSDAGPPRLPPLDASSL